MCIYVSTVREGNRARSSFSGSLPFPKDITSQSNSPFVCQGNSFFLIQQTRQPFLRLHTDLDGCLLCPGP